jgi:hypothetical protein
MTAIDSDVDQIRRTLALYSRYNVVGALDRNYLGYLVGK